MGKQYNKVENRRRRESYVKRKKAGTKAPKSAKAPAPAAANARS